MRISRREERDQHMHARTHATVNDKAALYAGKTPHDFEIFRSFDASLVRDFAHTRILYNYNVVTVYLHMLS